jgi:hypothetical protein
MKRIWWFLLGAVCCGGIYAGIAYAQNRPLMGSVVPVDNSGTVLFSNANPGVVSGIGITDNTAFGSQTFSPVMGKAITSGGALTSGNLYGLTMVPLTGGLRVDIDGATAYTPFVPAASDNHQVVKNGAGKVYKVTTSNKSATANYLRLYDAGTGFNGCNSATNAIFAMEIPPTDSGFSVDVGGAVGLAFGTGLSVCVTSGFGLTDTTNATATSIYVNIAYK